MNSETRRAIENWSLDDPGLSIRSVRIAFLETDLLVVLGCSIGFELWLGGWLTLSELEQRFKTFTTSFRRACNQARAATFLRMRRLAQLQQLRAVTRGRLIHGKNSGTMSGLLLGARSPATRSA